MSNPQHEHPLPVPLHPAVKTPGTGQRFVNYLCKTTLQIVLIITVGGLSLFLLKSIAGGDHSEKSIKMTAVASNYAWIAGTLVFPFVYVLLTAKLKNGVLWGWFLSWSLMFCISAFLPAMLIAGKPELKSVILNSFPEAIAVTPCFVLGWFPVLILCSIAWAIHKLVKKKLKRQCTNSQTEIPA